MAAGRFITFEGGEGVGKSTQVRLLAEALRKRGIDVITTREPGGSPGAEHIRRLLVEGDPERWDVITEALLLTAARHEHLRVTIWPALKRGTWVISDRFADSTIAYQGYGHRESQQVLRQLYQIAAGKFEPDLTLILDLPVDEGLRRASDQGALSFREEPSSDDGGLLRAARGGGEGRFERMTRAFHERLRKGFLEIAEQNPSRCVVVSAAGSVPDVQRLILAEVDRKLGHPSN